MGGGAGRGNRFFRMAQPVVGKALRPAHDRQEEVASHADVIAEAGSLSAIALGIVQRETYFKVPARHSEITQMGRELAYPEMHLPEKKRVSEAFGEAECRLGNR